MTQRPHPSALPAQPFFATPQQRLALARQRYFDEGMRPSGLVNETVIQSWSRCLQERRDPRELIAFNPVTASRIHSALARSRLLLDAAATNLDQLEQTLAGTACTAILTDPHGVVVHATRSAAQHAEVLLPLARRVGVNLDEAHVGTNAPGISLRTGQACIVSGGEHFFGQLHTLHCAAAPIRDVDGHIAAVLDLTSEGRPFGFDAGAVVALYATTIENQLLRAQSREHLVVQLQATPALLGTPMEGLAGLDASGRIAWLNNVAARLLGVAQGDTGQAADTVFGIGASRLAQFTRAPAATPHRLPSGLNVWIVARMQARDGGSAPVALRGPAPARRSGTAAAPTSATPPKPPAASGGLHSTGTPTPGPVTLRARDRDLIVQMLQACDGNVSQAARQLGVSRGLVYRHLRQGAG